MKTKSTFAIGFLIVANVVCLGVFAARKLSTLSPSKKTAPPPVSTSGLPRLPKLELKDDRGQEFSTASFFGSPLFVQFVNSNIDAQIVSFTRVREDRLASVIYWLVITNDAPRFRSKFQGRQDDLVVVESEDPIVRETFDVPGCCERWLVYDREGALRRTGSYSDYDASAWLRYVANGDEPYHPGQFVAALDSIGAFSQIRERTRSSESGEAVIAMFSSVCSSCQTGALIGTLNKYAKRNPKIDFLIVLPNTYTRDDVANFQTNLKVVVRVELADDELSRQWLSLKDLYGEREVNGTVLFVEKGEVTALKDMTAIENQLDKVGGGL